MSSDNDATVQERPASARSAGSAGSVTRLPGTVMRDRYELGPSLGRGGMGEVLSARDEMLGREVAIKRMLEEQPTQAQRVRFLREARIQGALDHPVIPPVHELAHDAEGRPFFVMKRLRGTALNDILGYLRADDAEMAARYPRERLLRALADVCLAVELAHTRGIVHRDIKPSNIMLGDFGEVFVLDWGVAKVLREVETTLGALVEESPDDELTRAGSVVGTPAYMAPEQEQGLPIDGKADVFALGCVLFEILAGVRVPGERPPSGLRPSMFPSGSNVAPELDALTVRATDPDATVRPTARALGESIQHYLDGNRDLAMRRQLAQAHLAKARTASEHRDDPTARATAMREAGRALALDPTLEDAAALVGALMLEPPAIMPPAVQASLDKEHGAVELSIARVGGLLYLAYALLVPYLLWVGVARPTLVYAYVIALVFAGATAVFVVRTRNRYAIGTVCSLVANTAIIFILARMFSPFVAAPGIAALLALFFVGRPSFRRGWRFIVLVAMMTGAVVVPLVLELVGVLTPTLAWTSDHIELKNLVVEIRAVPLQIGIVLYVVLIVSTAALARRVSSQGEEIAERRVHLQAWQLRQLVP